MRIYEALEGPREEVNRENARGRISADFYSVYPPGIPVMIPGERITNKMLETISRETFLVVKEK